MKGYRRGSHTLTNCSVHLVRCTKYRYQVLTGKLKLRCRDLLVQIAQSLDIVVLKGVVSTDHVHMHIEFPPKLSISEIMKRFKGKTSRYLQQEFPELKKKYWGKHFRSAGYFASTTGNVTSEMIQRYLEHHNDPTKDIYGESTFILEGA